MTKLNLIILIITATTLGCQKVEQNKDQLFQTSSTQDSNQKAPLNLDFETQDILRQTIEISENPELANKILPKPIELNEISQIQTDFFKQREKIEQKYGKVNLLIYGADQVGTAANMYLGSTGVGLPVAIGSEIVKTFIVKSLEQISSDFQNADKENVQRFIITSIKNMKNSDLDQLNQLRFQSPKDAKNTAEQVMSQYTNQLIPKGLSLEEETQIRSSLNEKIATKSIELFTEYRTTQDLLNAKKEILDNVQNKNIDQLNKQIFQLAKTQYEFKKEVTERFQSIYENQEKIVGFLNKQKLRLNSVENKVENLEMKNKFINDFLYTKMTPKEQINALRSGVYGDPRSHVIQSLINQKEVYISKQKMIEDFNSLTQGFQMASELATKAGLPYPVINAFQNGAKAFQASSIISQSILNQNYFSAAMSLTNLISNNKNPDDVRHEQLMNSLNRIEIKVDLIIALQKETINLLSQLSNQIASTSQNLADLAYSNLYMSSSINENIKNLLARDLDECFNTQENLITKYEADKFHFLNNLNQSQFQSLLICFRLIQTSFTQNKLKSPSQFYFSTYTNKGQASQAENVEQIYKKSVRFLQNLKYDEVILIKQLSLNPVLQPSDLSLKIKTENFKQQDIIFNFSNDLFESRSIIEYSKQLLNNYSLFSFIDNFNLPLNSTNLPIFQQLNTLNKSDYSILIENAIAYTNQAIAQESLLSGASLVEYYKTRLDLFNSKDYLDKTISTHQCSENFNEVCLLKINPELNRKVLALVLDKLLKENNLNWWVLDSVFELSDSNSFFKLDLFFQNYFQFELDKKNKPLYLIFFDQKYEISELNQLKQKAFKTSSFNELLRTRMNLINKLTELQLINQRR